MLALFFSMSCMTYPPLKKYNQDVRILLEQGKDNRWLSSVQVMNLPLQ